MSQLCGFHGSIAACLHLAGQDALSYLRSQMSVAIPNPNEHRWVYGLWMNENGRILADSYAVALAEDSCLLWSFGCPASLLTPTVQKNIVADEVEVTDLTGTYAVTVLGNSVEVRDWLEPVFREAVLDWPMPAAVVEADEFIALRGNPFDGEGLTLISSPSFHASLKLRLAQQSPSIEIGNFDSEAFAHARIANRVPLIPQDLNHRNLPQEGNFASVVVDFGKGCFPGQELMASFRKTGKIHKRLQIFQVEVQSPLRLNLPANIHAGASVVGSLTSLATWGESTLAMGLLRERAIERELSIRDCAGQEHPLRLLRS